MDKHYEKMDLVNDIDRLFYDIENIEDQASVFRAILRLNKISVLKGLKTHIILNCTRKDNKHETNNERVWF